MGHHFSTDLARTHPQLDLTDIYAFASDLPGKTCLVLIANPKSKAGASDNFSTDAIYKFHLGADRLHRDGLIYSVRFGARAATIGLVQKSEDHLGVTGHDLGAAPRAKSRNCRRACVSGPGPCAILSSAIRMDCANCGKLSRRARWTWKRSNGMPGNRRLPTSLPPQSSWRFLTACYRLGFITSLPSSGATTAIGIAQIAWLTCSSLTSIFSRQATSKGRTSQRTPSGARIPNGGLWLKRRSTNMPAWLVFSPIPPPTRSASRSRFCPMSSPTK